MKKILIFSVMMFALGSVLYGQTTTNIWPGSGPEDFAGTPGATTYDDPNEPSNEDVWGVWRLVNDFDWVLSQGSDNDLYWNNGPDSVVGNPNSSDGFAWARDASDKNDSEELRTPGYWGYDGQAETLTVDEANRTATRVELSNNSDNQTYKYKLLFDWKNDFSDNCIFNRAFNDNDPNPVEGYNNADLQLFMRVATQGENDENSIWDNATTGPGDLVEAGKGLNAGDWVQIWNEDLPDRVACPGAARTVTSNTNKINLPSGNVALDDLTVGVTTYQRDDEDHKWSGLITDYDGRGYWEYDSTDFKSAALYGQKYGGFADDDKEIYKGQKWWTTEIMIAGQSEDLPLTIREYFDGKLNLYGPSTEHANGDHIRHQLQFAFRYTTFETDPGRGGGLGGPIAIDNFRIVEIAQDYVEPGAGKLRINLYGRAVDMPGQYDLDGDNKVGDDPDDRDSSLLYTNVPKTLLPANGYTLELDLQDTGRSIYDDDKYFLTSRYDGPGINNPEGNYLSFAKVQSVEEATFNNALVSQDYDSDKPVFDRSGEDASTVYPLYREGVPPNGPVIYHQKLKIARPWDAVANPFFKPDSVGKYTIFLENNIRRDQIPGNIGAHQTDILYFELTQDVLAKDDGTSTGTGVGADRARGGLGSVFFIRNEEMLSHISIWFEEDPARKDDEFIVSMYPWDPINNEISGYQLFYKQYTRGVGGEWKNFPDVPDGMTSLRDILSNPDMDANSNANDNNQDGPYYILLIEQYTGKDAPINIGVDGADWGEYITYGSQKTGSLASGTSGSITDMSTVDDNGNLMMRLNFVNEQPVIVSDPMSEDDLELVGADPIAADNRIDLTANDKFTYTYAGRDRDSRPGWLTYDIQISNNGTDWMDVTSAAEESIAEANSAETDGDDGFYNGLRSGKIIGNTPGVENAGTYTVSIKLTDNQGLSSEIQSFDVTVLPSESIFNLPLVAEFDEGANDEDDTELGYGDDKEDNDGINDDLDTDEDEWDGNTLEYWEINSLGSASPIDDLGNSQTWVKMEELTVNDVYSDNDFPAGEEHTAVAITGVDYNPNENAGNADQIERLFSSAYRVPSGLEEGDLRLKFRFATDMVNMTSMDEDPDPEVSVDDFGGNIVTGFNNADVYIRVSNDGASWSAPIWHELDEDVETNKWINDEVIIPEDYLDDGDLTTIQVAFEYVSRIVDNEDYHPGYFAIQEVVLYQTTEEIIRTEYDIEPNWWFDTMTETDSTTNLPYNVPLDQLLDEYPFEVEVFNNGSTDLPYDLYLTVDVDGPGADFTNYAMARASELTAGNSAVYSSEDLEFNMEDNNIPQVFTPQEPGTYTITWRLHDYRDEGLSKEITFPPNDGSDSYIQKQYTFVVTDNTLRMDQDVVYGNSDETVSIHHDDPSNYFLGGSVGNGFLLNNTDQIDSIRIYNFSGLQANATTDANGYVDFSVSIVQDGSKDVLWTSDMMKYKGTTADPFDDLPDYASWIQPNVKGAGADLNIDLNGTSFGTDFEPGQYYIMINMRPNMAFGLAAGGVHDEYPFGDSDDNDIRGNDRRFENWLDGADESGSTWMRVDDNETGALKMELVFDTEKEDKNPIYVGDNYNSSDNGDCDKDNDGSFDDITAYNGVVYYYEIEGKSCDSPASALSLDLVNAPEDGWVTLESGADNQWWLRVAPESVVTGDYFAVVKLYETASGDVAKPVADKDGERTIKIFVKPTPSTIVPIVDSDNDNGNDDFFEDFQSADPFDMGWRIETSGNDLDPDAKWSRKDEDVDSDDDLESDGDYELCITSDGRANFPTNMVDYQDEWVFYAGEGKTVTEDYADPHPGQVYIPVPEAGTEIKLQFDWHNDAFKNSGEGDLYSGNPEDGFNNAIIEFKMIDDNGFTSVTSDWDQWHTIWEDTGKGDNGSYDESVPSQFHGKLVTFALRYRGRNGGHFCIDKIRVTQTDIDEYYDLGLTNKTDLRYKVPSEHLSAADVEMSVDIKNYENIFPYPGGNERPFVAAYVTKGSDDFAVYSDLIADEGESLTKDDPAKNMPFTLDQEAGEGVYKVWFEAHQEQGVLYDMDYDVDYDTPSFSNYSDTVSFSITDNLFANCAPAGGSADVSVLDPEGQSFTLLETDVLTYAGILHDGEQQFYFTIYDDAGDLIYQSHTFWTNYPHENGDASEDNVKWYRLSWGQYMGEIAPDDEVIPGTPNSASYYGIQLDAGTYTIEVNNVASNVGNLAVKEDVCDNPFILLKFEDPAIAWDDALECKGNTPLPYAIAGVYYQSDMNIGGTDYTMFNVKTNLLPVTEDSYAITEYSLEGISDAGGDWLEWVLDDPVSSTADGGADESLSNTTARAYLKGKFSATWMGTYTYKVDVTDDQLGTKAGEKAFDIHVMDALKIVTEDLKYVPDIEEFDFLDFDASGDFNYPIDEERQAGGLLLVDYVGEEVPCDPAATDAPVWTDAGDHFSITLDDEVAADARIETPLVYMPQLNDKNKNYRLRFDFKSTDGDFTPKVKVSTDGGMNWDDATVYTGDDGEGDFDQARINVTDFADASDSKLRFAIVMDGTDSDGDPAKVDVKNIVVEVIDVAPKLTIGNITDDYKYSEVPSNHSAGAAIIITVPVTNGAWYDEVRPIVDDDDINVYLKNSSSDSDADNYLPVGSVEPQAVNNLDNGESQTITFSDVPVPSSDDYCDTVYVDVDNSAHNSKVAHKLTYPFTVNSTATYAQDWGNYDATGIVGASNEFDIVAPDGDNEADWLTEVMICLSEAPAESEEITFYIESEDTYTTQTFNINDTIARDGLVPADEGAKKWYVYDIDDMQVDENVTVTIQDYTGASKTILNKDKDKKEQEAIRIALRNAKPEFTEVVDEYHYSVCDDISIMIEAVDDHDPQSALEFAEKDTWPSDWLSLEDNGDGTALVTGNATYASIGTNVVTVEVEDSENATNSYTFRIFVHAPGPEFVIEPVQDGIVGAQYSAPVMAVDSVSGDTMVVSVVEPASGWTVENGMLTGTPEQAGEMYVQLSASYEEGTFDCVSDEYTITQDFRIKVFDNAAPVVHPLADVTSYVGDKALAIQVTAEDLNKDQNITFSLGEGAPSWMQIDEQTGMITPVDSVDEATGGTEVTVIATDDLGLTGEGKFMLFVTEANAVPEFDSFEDQTVVVGQALNYQITASDGDDDNITISTVSAPAWLHLVSGSVANSVVLSGIPGAMHIGTSTVTLQVSDGIASFQANINVTVTENTAPAIEFDLETIAVGNTDTYTATITDAENDELIINVDALPEWLMLVSIEDNVITLEANVTAMNAQNEGTVVISAYDGINRTEESFDIEVTGDEPLGIATLDKLVKVYPNPAADILRVAAPAGADVTLYNALGQAVYAMKQAASVEEIDMSAYSNGMYQLRLTLGNETFVTKVVKQ